MPMKSNGCRVLSCCLLVFVLVMPVQDAQATNPIDRWVYVDPLDPRIVVTLERTPDSFGLGDVQFDADYCTDDSENICVKSRGFQFAVPKGFDGNTSGWNVRDAEYHVAEYTELRVFGLEEGVYLIDHAAPEGQLRFIFSPTRGLLGFGGLPENGGRLLLLESVCGFGSSNGCINK